MPDQEIIQEAIAKWLGFHKVPSNYSTQAFLWEAPNGGHSIDIPDFMESLDACFEWLVPKINYWRITNDELGIFYGKVEADIRIHTNRNPNKFMGWEYGSAKADTAALALFLAIDQLINTSGPSTVCLDFSQGQPLII